MKEMFKSIILNWKTSLIGLILISVGFFYFYLYENNLDNALSCITFGIGLLFTKDGDNKSLTEEEIIKVKQLINHK